MVVLLAGALQLWIRIKLIKELQPGLESESLSSLLKITIEK